jgi:PAS domain S-box-containing protein
LTSKDGTEISIDDSGAPIRDEKGDMIGIVIIFRDVRGKRKSEKALQESEERIRTIISASKDAMIVIDSNGLVELFNPAAQDLFGRGYEEMLGSPLDCLMPQPYRPQHQRDIASFFATGKPDGAIDRMVELPGERRDGTEFPMEISLSKGGTGANAFVLGVMRDITERKQAENVLRQY